LLTMALIQAARSLFPIRAWYHEEKVRSWLGRGNVSTLEELLQIQNSSTPFYDLPLQTLCGQIAAVAEAVLIECASSKNDNKKASDPAYRLLSGLAGKGGERDLELLQSGLGTASGGTGQTPRPAGAQEQEGTVRGESGDERVERTDLNIVRARLGTHIQRNIDHLQITVGAQWRRLIRRTAFWLSLGFSLTLLLSQRVPWQQLLALFGAAIIAGMISGYLASVFRDVVATIERLRHD